MSAAPSDAVLSVRGLTKTFFGFHAVKNVFLAPSSGTIRFEGRDITAMKPADVARLGLVRSFQISAVFPHLTVLDNVRVALQRREGLATQFWRSNRLLARLDGRAMELIEAVNLSDSADLPAVGLSYGRKRALEIATTLALDPPVLLFDEPMAGMGVEDIGRISQVIRRIGRGRTILMVEHNLSVVADLCDHVTVLARGEILAEGPYATVSADPQVREAYMGTEHA